MAPWVDSQVGSCYNGAVPVEASHTIATTGCSEVTSDFPAKPIVPCCGVRCSVIIPARNEAVTIADVVQRLHAILPDAEVIVVDNASTDDTAVRALAAGAIVISEPLIGKGRAMRAGATHARGDFLIFMDADGTYPPDTIPQLLAALQGGCGDVIVGSRLLSRASRFSPVRYLGNRALTALASWLHHPTTDFCSGFYVMSKDLWHRLDLRSDGFTIEPELFLKMGRARLRRHEIPVTYTGRAAGSKLNPLRDGYAYLWWLLKETRVAVAARSGLQRYRLLSDAHKIGYGRLLLYACLGLAAGGPVPGAVLVADLAATIGALAMAGLLNNFWDARVLGELNAMSALTSRPAHSRGFGFWGRPLALWLPLVVLAWRGTVSWRPVGILALALLLPVAYAVPPLRLKARGVCWGLLISPAAAMLLYLQAASCGDLAGPEVLPLAILAMLFQWYAELLQYSGDENRRSAWLPRVPLIGAAGGLVLMWSQPVFASGVLANMCRWWHARRLSPAGIRHARRRLTSPVFALFDFALYGIVLLWGWI